VTMFARRYRIIRLDPAGLRPGETACPRFRPVDFTPLRRSRPLVFLVAWLAFATQAAAECSAAGDESGFVFETTGEWVSARTGAPLRMLDRVCLGDEIRPPLHPRNGSSIAVAFYDETAVLLQCRSPQQCDAAYKVRATPTESIVQHIRKGLELFYPAELDLVSIPGVRGTGPREAVLERTSASLDFAPALADVGPGRYSVDLRPWTKAGPATGGTTIEVAWRRPVTTILSGAPPGPGLYELTLSNRAGDVVGSALVLVASDADFAAMNHAFDHVRSLADKWEDMVGESAARHFQVESLLAISRDPSVARGGP
jgi:hypothetical protein